MPIPSRISMSETQSWRRRLRRFVGYGLGWSAVDNPRMALLSRRSSAVAQTCQTWYRWIRDGPRSSPIADLSSAKSQRSTRSAPTCHRAHRDNPHVIAPIRGCRRLAAHGPEGDAWVRPTARWRSQFGPGAAMSAPAPKTLSRNERSGAQSSWAE